MVEGRRERKRRQLRRAISDAAMGLFWARGFDQVTLAEVAEAADVAEKTVYNHFPVKAEMVFDVGDEMLEHLLATIRGRPPQQPVITAVAAFYRDLAEWASHQRPARPGAAFLNLVAASPALLACRRAMFARWEQALADELAAETGAETGSVEPFVVAVAVVALLRAGFEATTGGPEATHHDALEALELLRGGLGGYAPARPPTPAEPTPAEPTPAELTPAEPTPAEPTPAEPTPAEPTPAGPHTDV